MFNPVICFSCAAAPFSSLFNVTLLPFLASHSFLTSVSSNRNWAPIAAADLLTVSSVSESKASKSDTRACVVLSCVCAPSSRVCSCHAQPQATPAAARAKVSTRRVASPMPALVVALRAGIAPLGAELTASSRLAAKEGMSVRSSRDIRAIQIRFTRLYPAYILASAWTGLFPL